MYNNSAGANGFTPKKSIHSERENISTKVVTLTEQGVSMGTINTAVNGITKGMGIVGANTTKSIMKVEAVTSVTTEISTKLLEEHLIIGGH